MAAPNIIEVNNIIGKTDVLNLTTIASTITANAAASGKVYKINALIVSNTDGVNDSDVTVEFFRSTTAYIIAKTITVPADSTLVVISKDMPIYLEEGDSLRCFRGVTGALQAICSYEIIGV